jgi:hypothetical protein
MRHLAAWRRLTHGEMLRIEQAWHEAEEIERGRRWLAEIASLAAAVMFKE